MTQPALKATSRPLYNLAIATIEGLIESGHYQPGDRLPPEEELAGLLGISRSTLRETMSHLEGNGVVIRRHGVGTFVAAPARALLEAGLEKLESLRSLAARAGAAEERTGWEVETLVAPAPLAASLSVRPGSALVRVQMTAAIAGYPFAYLDGYVPEHFVDFDELRAYPTGSLLDYLIQRGQVSIAYTRSEVHSVEAGKPIAAHLGLKARAPLLHLDETYFTDVGHPVVRSFNYFMTNRFGFHIVRRVVAGLKPDA
jgi:GntR family transcriptional regulator